MRCPRCEGLMVVERFCDVLDDAGKIYFEGLHCLVCGEILDATILMNRMAAGLLMGYSI
ncbi:MAG TPA: hypothetical protein VFH55_00985 [Nitrospiria bacterium]|nr:hypothetical protein [Nitrospiria bacterium]